MIELFLKAVFAFLTLDLGFFVSVFLHNWLWFFVFAATAFILFEGKSWFFSFFLVVFIIWASTDFQIVTNWLIYGKTYLMLTFFGLLIVGTFVEYYGLSKHLPVINSIRFIVLLAFVSMFL